ncbi:hypothetical protein [Streptomyces sp. NPDC057253]|uniref:hypothetical protein n=1 Tax=Streptomyces sp. NPDC057253 TaxID=3346069 RepID=UPI0036284B55
MDGEPVRPSPGSRPGGTGRIRNVVSEAVSAGAPGRRGGTEGRELGRGGTTPDADEPAPDSGGIGPGSAAAPERVERGSVPGVERSAAGCPPPVPGAGGASGKRAEAGGGGRGLSENSAPGFAEPGR